MPPTARQIRDHLDQLQPAEVWRHEIAGGTAVSVVLEQHQIGRHLRRWYRVWLGLARPGRSDLCVEKHDAGSAATAAKTARRLIGRAETTAREDAARRARTSCRT